MDVKALALKNDTGEVLVLVHLAITDFPQRSHSFIVFIRRMSRGQRLLEKREKVDGNRSYVVTGEDLR